MLTMGNTRKKRKGIGKKLTDLRDRLGLSQKKCAKRVGVTTMTWGRWERGDVTPHRAFLALIKIELGKF